MNLIQELEKEQVAKLSAGKDIPEFGPGDTVIVNVDPAPLTDKVNDGPLVHTNSVPPPAACVTTGAGNPPGSTDPAPCTTGEIVSHSVRLVTVVAPVFATTIRYFTGWPVTAPPGSTTTFETA